VAIIGIGYSVQRKKALSFDKALGFCYYTCMRSKIFVTLRLYSAHVHMTVELHGNSEFLSTMQEKMSQIGYTIDLAHYGKKRVAGSVWQKNFSRNLSPDELTTSIVTEYEHLLCFAPTYVTNGFLLYSIKKHAFLRDLKNKYPYAKHHQRDSVGFFEYSRRRMILALEMGLGKTLSALLAIDAAGKKGFIVVTKSLVPQWGKEIQEWFPDKKVLLIRGNTITKHQLLTRTVFDDYDFVVTNYETVKTFFKVIEKTKEEPVKKTYVSANLDASNDLLIPQEFVFKKTNNKAKKKNTEKEYVLLDQFKLPFSDLILVADEAYKIKTMTSELHVVMKKFAANPWDGIMILTGTPMENNLDEFYSLIQVLGSQAITPNDMKHNFYRYDSYGKCGYQNLHMFNKMLGKVMFRRTRSQLNLSDIVPSIIYRFVNAPAAAHRVKDRLIAHAREKGVINPIYTTLQTLDSYCIPSAELKLIELFDGVDEIIHEEKLEEVYSILAQVRSPILIFTKFAKTARWLAAKIREKGYTAESVSSKIPEQAKDLLKNDFKAKKYDAMVVTDVWAYGIDFPEIDYMIIFDLLDNPIKMAQRMYRIIRMNSTSKKNITVLVSDIIENDIYDMLRHKLANIERAVENTEEVDITKNLELRYGIKGASPGGTLSQLKNVDVCEV